MKKVMICILLSLSLFSGCGFRAVTESSETFPTFPELEFREDKAHRVEEVNIVYADGTKERRVYEYEEDWNVVKQFYPPAKTIIYYVNKEEVSRESFTWDEKFNITSTEKEGNIIENAAYTYDETGRIVSKVASRDGTELYTESYTYDDQNRIVLAQKSLGGEVLEQTETVWGENGKKQTVTVTDGAGAVLIRQAYTFDEKKYIETVLEYDGSGTLLRKIKNGYDINGLVVQEEIFAPDDTLLQTTYTRFVSYTYSYAVEVTEPTVGAQ